MRGFAFQVDRLVLEIEDHQFLHELSLEDAVDMEELPSELNLSGVSHDSSMSDVALLPPDPVSDDPIVESGVARLPPDELDCGDLNSAPIPAASSTPTHPSASPTSCVSQVQALVSASARRLFPGHLSDTSCSSNSSMDEEQLSSKEVSVGDSKEPSVVEPDSQAVESEVPPANPAASSTESTGAVMRLSFGDPVSPHSPSTSTIVNFPRTPQHVPPSSLQEAASSGMLGAAGWLEGPASTVQESVVQSSPCCSSVPVSTIPRALSTPLGSNNAPVGGATNSNEAVHPDGPASTDALVLEQNPVTEGPEADHSHGSENTDGGTHPTSPSVCAAAQAPPPPGSSLPDGTAALGSSFQDMHQSSPLSSSSVGQLCCSLPHSPVRPDSPERSTDQSAAVEKLALADSHPPASGWLFPGPSQIPVPVVLPKALPPAPSDSAPSADRVKPPQDSSIQLQVEADSVLGVRGAESGVDPSTLDVSLEGGAQVPMDRSVVEQLRNGAAKEVATWDNCLSRMNVNEHPDCPFPHVSGVKCDMRYYTKTEAPERVAEYDEFQDMLLRNNLTADVIENMYPFVVRHVVARLHQIEYSVPEELLPSLEASLHWHREELTVRRGEQLAFVKSMDSKLRQLVEEEAVPVIASGNIVPPHRDSDSSFLSEGDKQTDLSPLVIEEVEPEELPGPIKLEDQLHQPLVDHSAPDCDDYPWGHPHFRAPPFQARQWFCNKGMRIPIWFRGEEQLGGEAVQVPVGEKTPVDLVQAALVHQCSKASRAIRQKVQEICDLERFAADAHTACFRAGAGDLQFGLLHAGVAPSDLWFPLMPRETQETGCQAGPCTQSTATQDGPGTRFINRKLMDCVLQSSSTLHMDKYLQTNGYGPINEGDNSGHPFRLGSRVIGADGSRFRPVLPITLRTTLDSEVQDFRDLDLEMHSMRPFRGVHLLAYTDDMYPVVLPTRSRWTFITEQLSCTVVELAKLLPQKDSLLSRGEYVKAQSATVDPALSWSNCGVSETESDACGSIEAACEAHPFEAAQGGQEMDSRTEVEVAPHEPAPSQGAFRPLWVAPQTGGAQAVMEQLPVGIHMKAQKKMPPPFLSEQECHSPPHSCTESFELGGDDILPPEDHEESDGRQLQMAPLTVSDNVPPKTEGASDTDATTASAATSRLPTPQLTEDGCVLPPCTVGCFPAPQPDWAMEVTHKDLSSCLPESLPAVQGVAGNRGTALLSLDFEHFIPKEEMSDTQARLRTTTSIQVALRKVLVHPDVEGSLLPPPTDERHPGLITVDDLRCLSPAE